jgi:hypothetical protein
VNSGLDAQYRVFDLELKRATGRSQVIPPLIAVKRSPLRLVLGTDAELRTMFIA